MTMVDGRAKKTQKGQNEMTSVVLVKTWRMKDMQWIKEVRDGKKKWRRKEGE